VSGVKYKAADSSIREARAHLTVVCDGMYSNFRKPLTKSADVHHPSFFVGLLLRNVQLPYANHGHVVLAEPSPVLFYPISPTEVRLETCNSNALSIGRKNMQRIGEEQ
jgi:squalene monooxygenase